jgi:hypothetical protein
LDLPMLSRFLCFQLLTISTFCFTFLTTWTFWYSTTTWHWCHSFQLSDTATQINHWELREGK